MPGKIRVQHIVFREDDTVGQDWEKNWKGCDGYVLYEILIPCAEARDPCGGPCKVVCDEHPAQHHRYEMQPFARGEHRHKPDATAEQIANDEANIWGWCGNKNEPTLSPSYLGPEVDKRGRVVRDYRIHLHLTSGKIVLASDSTVQLA